MVISFSCPVSGKMRDNTTARVVAGFVFIISGAALLVSLLISAQTASIITGILSIDFIIRAFYKPKYSLLATLARGFVSGLKLPPKMVDSGPKVFAARIGVIFSVVTTVLFAANLLYIGVVVIVILLLCASLESFLSFCLGCWMYSFLPKNVGNALSKEFVN
jgi:hypothetical protein